MEAPSIFFEEYSPIVNPVTQDQPITWKNFCKKKFTMAEMKSNIRTISRGL